jgi:predicted NAD/FAD-binding protein
VRIAVVGAGISGLSAAYLLARSHSVTLYEQEARLGGHAHTHDVVIDGRTFAVDTGFMVFNAQTYPNFVRLLAELGVESRPSDMSFSVRCRRCGIEYSSVGLDGLFAQRSRLLSGGHWRLLADILKFFRLGRRALAAGLETRTLGEFLDQNRFGEQLARHFVLPMGGAIWSASPQEMRRFPAASYLRFMDNHGLLAAAGQPQWRTIPGGSRTYVAALARRLGSGVRAGTPVRAVARSDRGASITTADGTVSEHEAVVVATHADQALALLADPSPRERDALGRFRYSANDTCLHSDERFLPAEPHARASWNCDLADCQDPNSPISVTYDLNRLQGHRPGRALLCTLNPIEPVAGETIARMTYTHPILDAAAIEGQGLVSGLNGERRTWFCGAHLRYGFHEDGMASAVAVARGLGVEF